MPRLKKLDWYYIVFSEVFSNLFCLFKEIELDQAKENGDLKLQSELSDALFVLQRLNSERLTNLITDYQPALSGKNWGPDPEHAKLSRRLVKLAESYALPDNDQANKRK
jgi:hypothetical protein